MMKILMAASECVPFVKTGGLADVIGALPKALSAEGIDVRVVIPKYVEIPESYRTRMTHLVDFTVELGWRRQYCGIDTLTENGITFYAESAIGSAPSFAFRIDGITELNVVY